MKDDLNAEGNHIAGNGNAGQECGPGPVSIQRRVSGMDVIITISPENGGDLYLISAAISGSGGIGAVLVLNGWEIETMPDLSERKTFRTPVSGGTDTLLIFRKNNEVLFTMDLILEKS